MLKGLVRAMKPAVKRSKTMSKTSSNRIVIGRLVNDPKLHTGGKIYCCKFTISHSTIDKDGVEGIQQYKIAAFGKQIKVCLDNLCKGDLCCIEGPMNSDILVAERITFLSRKKTCITA